MNRPLIALRCWPKIAAFLFIYLPSTPQAADSTIITAHLMVQESPFILKSQKNTPLDQPNGIMAFHLPATMQQAQDATTSARADIELAKQAGLTTFTMLLGPNHLPKSYISDAMHAYWRVSRDEANIKMAVDIWSELNSSTIDKLAEALKILHDDYGDAWQKYNGRFLIFLGNASNFSSSSAADLDELFKGLGGRQKVYLVAYDTARMQRQNKAFSQLADAVTDWPHSDYADEMRLIESGVQFARKAGRPYVYPVMPAFMQSRPSPEVTPNIREKLGATNFSADWLRAISAKAKIVNVATWNDLTEDSALQPDSNHQDGYLRLNKFYSEWLSSGSPIIGQEFVTLFHHPQLVKRTILPKGKSHIQAFPWMSSTPPTDYVSIVSILRKPLSLIVTVGGKSIARTQLPAGYHQVLVYVPSPDAKNEAYPQTSTNSSIFPIAEMPSGHVVLELADDKKFSAIFRSHADIQATAVRSELTTIGNAFKIVRDYQ